MKPSVRWALFLLLLALLPVASALRPGFVYGPFDTNAPYLPWVDATDAGYVPQGHRLNDITLQFLPWQAEARRQILQGRAPLLNPFSGAGHPLLGSAQAAPLSYVSLLALPVEPLKSQAFRAFLKLLLALAGTWLCARQLGVRPPVALLAAVGYAWGGSLTVWQLYPHAEVMALFPFAFLASERVLADARDLRSRLLFGLALAGILLAGHPETAFTACFALAARWLPALRHSRRAVGILLLASVLAALGTSFFLLPVAQSVLGSEKLDREGGGRDLDPLQAPGGAAGALLTFVAPGVYGTPRGAGEAGPGPLQWLAEGAVGLPLLVFALGGLFARKARSETEIYLIALAAFSFLVHLDPGGLLRPVFVLPGVSVVAVRYFAYLGGFAVALLGAKALEDWMAEAPDRRFRFGMAGAAILALSAALLAHPRLSCAILSESLHHSWVAVAVALGIGIVLLLRRFPIAAGLLAAALTAGQLWDGLGGYYPVIPRDRAYPPVPLLDRLAAEPGPFRIVGTRGVFMPNASTWYRIADLRAHDPMQPARYIAWLHEMLDVDITRHKRQYGPPRRRHVPFLRLLGTRYLLAPKGLKLGPPWLDRGVFRQTRLWEMPGDVRWAFVPDTVIPAASARDAREILRSLPRPLQTATLELPAGAGPPRPNGRARVLGWEVDGDRLSLRTEVQEPAWIVISQAAIPGWHATADGKPIPTVIADGALLAVQAPAGTRVLRLWYRPRAWTVGIGISVAAWLLSALLLGYGIYSRKDTDPDLLPVRDTP